jgi:N utilization substance protein A
MRDVDGMSLTDVVKLNRRASTPNDDLADLATDELTDITGQSADEYG